MQLRFGDCTFDPARRELTRNGVRVDLTPKAFALLEMLIAARPAAISKEDLYERLWPATFVEQGNLHNLIAYIRAAIGDADHTIVRTVHRVGYAFDAPVGDEPETSEFVLVIGDREVALQRGANLIGRDSACEVVLNTADVSRHHARLTISTRATLEDLGSKNGTFVRTKRITSPEAVDDGDEIVIGRTHVTLRRVRRLDPTITVA